MNTSTLRTILWILLCLPVFAAGLYVFRHTMDDERKAARAKERNE